MKPSNQYDWNVTRKFSWGHIVAFVALIFMSYVMYMGAFYSNGGNFLKAAAVVVGIDVLILGVFIGAQLFKGTDGKFDRCIILERILICLCPAVFVLAMMSYNHFWGVYSQRQEIETRFNEAIAQSGSMFDEYDKYVEERLGNYQERLNRLRSAGVITDSQQRNYYLTLQLQLRNKDQQQMEEKALKWIGKANTGASVWNAFLIGNLNQIRSAVKGWEETLDQYSRPVLSNETSESEVAPGPDPAPKERTGQQQEVLSFSQVRSAKGLRENLFVELQKRYSEGKGLQVNTIWTGLILFAMLLFPYMLQKRNTRAHGYYHLWPWGHTDTRPRTDASHNGFYSGTGTGSGHYPDTPHNGTQRPPKPNFGGDSDIYSGTM